MKLRTYGQIIVACIALTSCSVMPAGLLSPMQEEPTDTEESYLERGGGPQSRVELGAGEEHLLTRFQTVLEEKEKLEKEHKGLQAELELLRTTLDTERTGRERESRVRVGAEAEAERLRVLSNERELKILHLQLRVAELERSKLKLEIAGLETEIAQRGAVGTKTPAGPKE